MLTYADYRTPAEFDAGYANFIDAPVVEKWEFIFREASRKALSLPHFEIAYGLDERNRIDIFPARGVAPDAPVLVAIHGGLWFLFDKWMMHFLAPAWTAAGVHIACPNYRLAPGASLDAVLAESSRQLTYFSRRKVVEPPQARRQPPTEQQEAQLEAQLLAHRQLYAVVPEEWRAQHVAKLMEKLRLRLGPEIGRVEQPGVKGRPAKPDLRLHRLVREGAPETREAGSPATAPAGAPAAPTPTTASTRPATSPR